jgi:CDGSH-type Zn-finger protein
LQAKYDDGRAAEAAPPRNELHIVADGPHHLRGDIEVREDSGKALARETRMALCRCGASGNKPYCDNSHVGSGFKDEGTCTPGEKLPVATGPLTLTLCTDGPVQCDGPVAVFDVFGEQVATVQQAWLCRCGASKNKPYCDGSHTAIGFRS